jgi:hypothetical protein
MTMDYNIIMNFKCTKIKQKITNGNHNVLLFVMYSNTVIEIIKMLMVMMIHCNGNGSFTTWNTMHKMQVPIVSS